MRVVNSHKRDISQPKELVSEVFKTLASEQDKIWPYENWPAIKFKNGVCVGSRGGHGPIRYTIIAYTEGDSITFEFDKRSGFNGWHQFKIIANDDASTTVSHTIEMHTNLKASIKWILVIRWLHDALIEEAFDKIENNFSEQKKITNYNFWVRLLRAYFKRRSIQTKERIA